MRKEVVIVLSLLIAVTAAGESSVSQVCNGDRVNFGGYVGTAVEVFSNGTAKIDVDGYSNYTFKNINELGKGVRCFNGACQNDRVNFEGYAGTVVEVFTNGTVKIDVDGYSNYTYKSVDELGIGQKCVEDLCKNQRVNFGSYVGTTVEVFSNGVAKIDVDGYSNYTYKSIRELGKGYRCVGVLCSGNRVNFDSYTGTAVEVFTNGTVKIDVDGYSNYTYKKARQLGYEIDCSNGPNSCQGRN